MRPSTCCKARSEDIGLVAGLQQLGTRSMDPTVSTRAEETPVQGLGLRMKRAAQRLAALDVHRTPLPALLAE